jgi:hypothetical protein
MIYHLSQLHATNGSREEVGWKARPSVSLTILQVVFGGGMILVLAIGPKVAGSNPAESDGVLMAIKIFIVST